MIKFLIQNNYACFIMCLLMLVYLAIDRSFEKKVRRLFGVAVWAVLLLTFADSCDLFVNRWNWSILARNCSSAFGAILRPLPIFCIALIIRLYRAKQYYWIALPFFVNFLLALFRIPSNIYIAYNQDNVFFLGLITYSPYIVCFFYMFVLLALTLMEYRQNGMLEMLTVIMIALITAVATIMESFFDFEFVLNITMIAGLLFYYLFLHVQIYKRDSLTNLLNRRSFYLDAMDHLEETMTITEIDLNNLKKINDSNGHSAGDAAILVVVNVIKSVIGTGYTLYRTGGDEFTLLGYKKSVCESEGVLLRVIELLEDTPYHISYGVVEYEPGMSLERVVKNADEKMYRMKRDSKLGRNDSEKKS